MALKEQHIDHAQLVDVSVLLELGAHLGADLRHRHVERVHLLDLWGL